MTAKQDPSVLIVEDERIARKALQALLDASGYHTSAHETAESALEEVTRDGVPDCMVVDVDLPGMSGLDLIVRLERLDAPSTIIVTTACEDARMRRFLKSHRIHYLPKPLELPRLLDLLDRASPKH